MRKSIFALALVGLTASAAHAQIGSDDFDGGGTFLSRMIDPDNSGNDPMGSFPGSRFDVFGIVDRNVNFDFADDSAGSFPPDTFGILQTGKTDNVFGVEDLTNPDNTGGTGSLTYTFDISGFSALSVGFDFAAIGDFEVSNDLFNFTASIDGGPAQTLFSFTANEDIDQTYTLESGTQTTINDPLTDLISGTVLSNGFQTLFADVAGTGSVLTLTFSATSDGGSEVFLFDNLLVRGSPTAVPEPASLALMGLGAGVIGLASVSRRRRRTV